MITKKYNYDFYHHREVVRMYVSDKDFLYWERLQKNVVRFLNDVVASNLVKPGSIVLDAGSAQEDFSNFFPECQYQTLEIDQSIPTTYHGDMGTKNECLKDGYFDCVMMIEVLEHVQNPFGAAQEIERILKPNGLLILTVPFNFQTHSDYWRFTPEGLRLLFHNFKNIYINGLSCDEDRPAMPIQYTMVARKK
jgi:SAM-dependent methyltransferase